MIVDGPCQFTHVITLDEGVAAFYIPPSLSAQSVGDLAEHFDLIIASLKRRVAPPVDAASTQPRSATDAERAKTNSNNSRSVTP